MRKTLRKSMLSMVLASLTLGALSLAAPVFGQATPAAQPAHYSVEKTLIGKLIDDPAAAAILKKLIPNVWANQMFQSMGREQTLRGVQQFEQDVTDAKLAEIQAEFDKIPAKG